MKIQGDKRYALLLTANDSEYVKKVYGGYFNVFVDALGDIEGEKWDLFRVVEGEFPKIEDLQNYEGFVVSGSPFDAYGHESWILQLCFLLKTLFAMQKKVLGFCFGHQVLCRALGGKVAKSCTGWDIGVRKVNLTEDFYSYGFSSDGLAEIPSSLSLIECHQDEVWEVPVGAQVLADSDKTGVEMFSFGDNILGIQGHPEYTEDILDNLIDRLLSNNFIEGCFAEEVKLQLTIAEPNRKYWERICKAFLKGDKSLTKDVVCLVVGASTSHAIWSTLECAFAFPSQARIMQLRLQLQTIKQGDASIQTCFQQAKTVVDELAATGPPLSDIDFNLYIFKGLHSQFHDSVTTLTAKSEPLPCSELLSFLLTQEFLHEDSISTLSLNPPNPSPSTEPSAHYSQREQPSPPIRGCYPSHNYRGRG
ncbi:hypothetical protein BUALT_Bualt12G0072100 [Buddleja alternifolia]|uniref:Glutamine amidotransferase domain-containing protein n=1 Tax=Buddleja alternifolia TaxID=168488 RepID=A0AAV6WWL7_9LAMI|nr:hypothetical protein BUALT_Bualt12G0072100 [Buddleja alternifolia]